VRFSPRANPTPTATRAPPPSTIAIQAGTSGTGPNKNLALTLGRPPSAFRISISDAFGHQATGTPSFVARDTRVPP